MIIRHPSIQRSRGPSHLAVVRYQRGVALVVALVFIVALAGIALLSARSALMGESVSRNQLDIQVARQSAEAALRDAEKDLLLPSGSAPAGAVCPRGDDRPVLNQIARFSTACRRGQCSLSDSARLAADFSTASPTSVGEAWWPVAQGGQWNNTVATKPSRGSAGTCANFDGAVPLGTFTGTAAISGVARQPEYLIEPIRRGESFFFRITARGFGYRLGTEVVLQSYFLVPPL
ncbi:pilus assembly protein PilX [Aquabacterium olei]|uniref:Pilus assembly protein PilX n=1 Tax=Aquabacterium olei TaxID=1296669 RepID=A0A2U8FQF7_9BURK|nr:PilX N-terminal domain-containing pilus assembly protein [Aquabacterium olei]AWI52546.1 pilus assembly protein PilX [Aquabacterium olei]